LLSYPWWWEAAPLCEGESEPLPAQVDAAVIGSGFTGLSAALTLLKGGLTVAVLERDRPGEGASTRNGGQVGSGNQKFTVKALVARYGERQGRALLREGQAALDYIGALIEKQGIACHFARVGRFRGALRPEHYEALARDAEDLARHVGVEYRLVPPQRQREEIESPRYHGGVVLPNDATVHPGLLHHGLMARVEQAGGQVLGKAPLTAVRRVEGQFHIETPRGALRSEIVVVATNGYSDRSLPQFRRRIVPLRSAMVATEELPEELLRRLMPKNRAYGSTGRVFHYYRLSPDGRRLLFGGRVNHLVRQTQPAAFGHLRREIGALFPELAEVGITHGWWGWLGYPRDTLPHLGRLGGLYYAMGYSGSGVSRSLYLGRKVALKALGDPAGKTAFDDQDLAPFPGRDFAALGVPLVQTWYRLLDAVGR
jgi:glycine/D-amino acid oxidase-like deaminating enzyme